MPAALKLRSSSSPEQASPWLLQEGWCLTPEVPRDSPSRHAPPHGVVPCPRVGFPGTHSCGRGSLAPGPNTWVPSTTSFHQPQEILLLSGGPLPPPTHKSPLMETQAWRGCQQEGLPGPRAGGGGRGQGKKTWRLSCSQGPGLLPPANPHLSHWLQAFPCPVPGWKLPGAHSISQAGGRRGQREGRPP